MNSTLTPTDAAAMHQGGMRFGELRTLIENGIDLEGYLAMTDTELASLKLRRVIPQHRDLGDCQVLLRTDPRYPRQLLNTKNPPELLYVRGSLDALDWGVAVIGTRDMTRIGAAVATAAVAAAGTVDAPVVSGLARGCDITAHRAALDAGLQTVAVLACGIDETYPKEHGDDVEKILAGGGAVISEQPFTTAVNPQRLMARNRIIVGLSACVIPCEAGRNSRGTIQAVGTAFAEGRFVIAARVKESWRAAPGAWLSERLTRADVPVADLGWVNAAEAGANGVAETGADLAEMVRFSVLFQRA